MIFEIVTPPFAKFVMSFGMLYFACASVMYAAIARRLVFLHLIGGGLVAHLGVHTPQVSQNVTVYTLSCSQSYAPLCDWFTPGTVYILSTMPRKHISKNQPIKGIININQNLKVISKYNYCC